MTHLKYRYLQILRSREAMFWGMLFPIILGTLFFLAFGNMGVEHWEKVPVAVVETGEDKAAEKNFRTFLDQLDGEYLTVRYADADKAENLLKDGKVSGIYTLTDKARLTVSGSGIRETMLDSFLDGYYKAIAMADEIAQDDYTKLEPALKALSGDRAEIKSVSAGGRSYDTSLEYFFALIAMACGYGCFLGGQLSEGNCPPASTVACRRSVSPQHKNAMVLQDVLVGVSIQFCAVMLLIFYLEYVLKISFSGNLGGMALVALTGSLLGVTFGMLINSIGRLSLPVKTGLAIALPLLSCFLAGLMFGDMKRIIEAHIPLLNRLNPAALISDAMYFLNIYDDPRGFYLRLAALAVMALSMAAAAIGMMRRNRYDSI